MQEIKYQTFDISSMAGMADVVTGTLDVGKFSLGYQDYDIPDGIKYSITLSNVGDAIVLTGRAYATVKGECARCLEPAEVDLQSDIEGYLALNEESDVTGMEDDEYIYIPDDGEVDLAPYVFSAIVVEIPTVLLCKEDCKGLCPTCGCNRNVEQCDCENEIDESSPFYALKDYFAKDDDEDDAQ